MNIGIGRFLNKPEYLYRPTQIIRRALPSRAPRNVVHLPWGSAIRVDPNDGIGRAICHFGVYDLVLTEAITRLLDRGETALDIGANIGYTANVMSWRAGAAGKVICFEPCASVYAQLIRNLHGTSEAHHCGVSSHTGTALLHIPPDFSSNNGLASFEDRGGATEQVPIIDLDTWLPLTAKIGLMKLDVEGHEMAVVEGARKILADGRVRDVLFEDHRSYPTDVQLELQAMGYAVFRLSREFRRPLLLPADDASLLPVGVLPNFLATRDSERACKRFSSRGWKCLA